MQQRQILNRMLGIAVFAMLFGASSVQAQSGSTSGSAGQGASSSAQSGSGSASSAASAGKEAGGKEAGGKSMSKSDQNIMREMAMSNLAEIETGKIALSQSKNDQVRNFAQKMIDDHQQSQKELEQLAQSKGVTLPTEPDKKHQAAAKKLSSLEGDKFDKQYMKQGGLSDHRNTHRLLQRAQTRATDPDLKALAAKMEPIVSQHLTLAQDVSGTKGSASGSQGPAGTSASGSSSGSSSGTSGSDKSGSDKSGASGTSGSSNSTSPSKQ